MAALHFPTATPHERFSLILEQQQQDTWQLLQQLQHQLQQLRAQLDHERKQHLAHRHADLSRQLVGTYKQHGDAQHSSPDYYLRELVQDALREHPGILERPQNADQAAYLLDTTFHLTCDEASAREAARLLAVMEAREIIQLSNDNDVPDLAS